MGTFPNVDAFILLLLQLSEIRKKYLVRINLFQHIFIHSIFENEDIFLVHSTLSAGRMSPLLLSASSSPFRERLEGETLVSTTPLITRSGLLEDVQLQLWLVISIFCPPSFPVKAVMPTTTWVERWVFCPPAELPSVMLLSVDSAVFQGLHFQSMQLFRMQPFANLYRELRPKTLPPVYS